MVFILKWSKYRAVLLELHCTSCLLSVSILNVNETEHLGIIKKYINIIGIVDGLVLC